MTRLNAVGDVILEDPRAMLALAVPARLTLHAALRRHGPATVDELATLLGDDPRAMLALADPARLTLHAVLRRHGAATVDELAALLGDEPRATATQLESLEEVGLVERSGQSHVTWAVVGKGIFFEIPEDAEAQSAARQLSNAMLVQYADLPRRWVSDDEPRLPVQWARAAGMFNARLVVTPDELGQIQAAL